MKFTVGQKLWWVQAMYGRRCEPAQVEVEIKKVGRKWLELTNHYRIKIETMLADGRGYASPGTCYLSQQEYLDDLALRKAWHELQKLIERRKNTSVTKENIQHIRPLLGENE